MRGVAKPCKLVMNGHKTGYIFTPIECRSIAEAIKIARECAFLYRIFDMDGKLVRQGWFAR